MDDITRVIYANENFHHYEAKRLFEPVPLDEIKDLAAGSIVWMDSDLASHVYAYEKAEVRSVSGSGNALAISCVGLKSGMAYWRQVKPAFPPNVFRLKDESRLAEFIKQEPRLLDPRLQVA